MTLILIFSFLVFLLLSGTSKSLPFINKVKYTVFTAFLFSLLILCFPELINNWIWPSLPFSPTPPAFQLDLYARLFLPIMFFVSWCILEFSTWDTKTDPETYRFFSYLLIFLAAMTCLITANNLFTFFIGWEVVSIMSFLLIHWHRSQTNTAFSAVRVVLWGQAGDMGLLLAFCWMTLRYSSTDLPSILSTKPPLALLVGLILAAAGKLAQFSLRSWVTAAMQSPTPISALLHSSSAIPGIFLLIRIHPLIEQNQTASTLCFILGAILAFYATTLALFQYDIQKIIAYSTSSQLGFMMVAIGINQPNLAFLLVSTHALLKAMLFLCSELIYNLSAQYDIRKMSGLMYRFPTTMACLTIGSFALMATPLLAWFYSKTLIIEALSASRIHAIAFFLTLIVAIFSTAYLIRLMFYTTMPYPRYPTPAQTNENMPNALNPVVFLVVGSVCAGIIIASLLPMKQTTILGSPSYLHLAILTLPIPPLAYFLLQLAYYKPRLLGPPFSDPLESDFMVPQTLIPNSPIMAWHIIIRMIERAIIEKLAPELLISTPMTPAQIMESTQKGRIKLYLLTLGVSMALALFFAIFIFPPP